MDYSEALDHLDSLINHEAKPRAGAIEGLTLDTMSELVGVLGDPQDAYPVIHLTGTNGKGSTGRMIESILTVVGLRVGLYSSPHVHSTRERIRVGGEDIDEESFAMAVSDVARVQEIQGLGPLTWFETVTGAAFLHFANEAVDVAIIEVGLLGRFDATNVATAQIAVVTNVGLDHTDGEDGWRERVAAEKVGIIAASSTVVLGEADDELRALVDAESPAEVVVRGDDFEVMEDQLAVGGRLVEIRTSRTTHEDLFVALHGAHQALNASLAVAVVEEFFDAATPTDVLIEAFDSVELPGRLEVIHRSPMVLVDAAHNVPGAEALTSAVIDDFGGGARRFLVVGIQDGRDLDAVMEAFAVSSYELVITCTAPSARGIRAADLADAAAGHGASTEAIDDVVAAIDRALALAAEDDIIVIAGSVTVVEVARDLRQEW